MLIPSICAAVVKLQRFGKRFTTCMTKAYNGSRSCLTVASLRLPEALVPLPLWGPSMLHVYGFLARLPTGLWSNICLPLLLCRFWNLTRCASARLSLRPGTGRRLTPLMITTYYYSTLYTTQTC